MYDANMTTETISCPTHGESEFAYVCKHLIDNPLQQWHCGYPEQDAPWRDAWCGACNAAFEREGEWNENNEGEADIGLLCGRCYEDGIARSVGRLQGAALAEWESFLDARCASLQAKQDAMNGRLNLNAYPRWDYQQENGELVFSGGAGPDLVAQVEFVGTLSTASNTWLWSWANFSLLEPVRSRIGAVRDLGEERGYPHLTVPKWHADMHDGWHMTAIAAEVLGALGAYRVPSESGYIFMIILTSSLKSRT
jgi:hypothetical protein